MLRTRSQRNILCRECPIARVADLMGDPCSLLVMRNLVKNPMRFSELESSLAGMSPRTLTKVLRRLEKDKFISRKYFSKPKRFHYEVTTKGRAFGGVLSAMRSYGKKYL